MKSELIQAVLVDVFKHANSAAGHATALLQTVNLTGALGLLFAQHVVVIVREAARANVI